MEKPITKITPKITDNSKIMTKEELEAFFDKYFLNMPLSEIKRFPIPDWYLEKHPEIIRAMGYDFKEWKIKNYLFKLEKEAIQKGIKTPEEKRKFYKEKGITFKTPQYNGDPTSALVQSTNLRIKAF